METPSSYDQANVRMRQACPRARLVLEFLYKLEML